MGDEFDDLPGDTARRAKKAEQPDYRCSANGCPVRATITDGTQREFKLGRCRYHDAHAPHRWSAITAALRNADLANPDSVRAQMHRIGVEYLDGEVHLPALDIARGTLAEVAAYHAARMRETSANPAPGPRQWAHRLKARELAGEPMLPAQSCAWRGALCDEPMTDADAEAIAEREAIQAER
jgi:hypothetical protein